VSTDYAARAAALTALGKASAEFPELRLCQILGNAFPNQKDLYHVTDRDLASGLKKYIEWQKEQEEQYKEWRNNSAKNNSIF
jgi:hypothetical protein